MLVALFAGSAASQTALDQMTAEATHTRWNKLEKIYKQMSAQEKLQPQALYLAGYSLMRMHKPLDARPLFQKAIKGGFHGWPSWTTAEQLVKDVDAMQALMGPHLLDVPAGPTAKLRVFGRQTTWSSLVLRVMPAYVNRVTEIFGSDLPVVNVYFFDDRAKYERFFKLMFRNEMDRSWQDGTGDSNIVVFCELQGDGRRDDTDLAQGDVLHEYGHCLCNTVFGDNYLSLVPQWFDEGAADAIAQPYADRHFNYARRLLKKEVTSGTPPPTYQQMTSDVYKEPLRRYAYARLMMQELLQGLPLSTLKTILNKASQLQNFDAAIVEVTGINPPDLIARVRARYGAELSGPQPPHKVLNPVKLRRLGNHSEVVVLKKN
jgi:hypothetical protein